MRDIREGTTWVVWIDYQGKWHSSDEGWILDPMIDELARRYARALVGDSNGSADFIGTAQVAYCIHAKGRYKAMKIAKKAFSLTLLAT